MLELIGTITSALYAAFTAFVLSVQALVPLLPWQASIVLSGVLAGIAAISTWAFIGVFRRR